MNQDILSQALDAAKSAAQEAGEKLLPHYGRTTSKIKEGDPGEVAVFNVLDGRTEHFLHDTLLTFSKDVGLSTGFRGEEHGDGEKGEYTWVVDPVDGTTHFSRGLPFCTTMIALAKGGEVLLGVIHNIAEQTTYWAAKGQGSFRDGERLNVSHRKLNESVIDFETRLDNEAYYQKYIQVSHRAGMWNTLNSGFEFSMIASGKLDGRICLEPYGKDWDFAAGSLLVSEAGGVARNFHADSYDYRNHDFIVSNQEVYKELTLGSDAIFRNGSVES